MGISARRYQADRQDIMNIVTTNTQDRQRVYNLTESKKIEFAYFGIYILIIVNFILLWLFQLLNIVTNFLIALRQ